MSAPSCSSTTIDRRSTPTDALDIPPYSSRIGLPSSDDRNLSVVARSLRSSSGSSLSSQYLKTRARMEVWVSLRSSTLPSSSGPNELTVARTWRPELAAQRQELDRVPGRREWHAQRRHSLDDLRVRRVAGRRHARQVALDVGDEDRHARLRQLAGHQLEGLRLARARRPRDETVAVEHAQGDRDMRLGDELTLVHRATDRDRRLGERVPRRNRLAKRPVHRREPTIALPSRRSGRQPRRGTDP